MTQRSLGGSGISLVLHAALFVVLIYVAAQPSPLAAPPIAGTPAKFVYIVRPGPPGAGGATTGIAPPRAPRVPERVPVSLVPPQSISHTEPPPITPVPVIAAEEMAPAPGVATGIDGIPGGKGRGTG